MRAVNYWTEWMARWYSQTMTKQELAPPVLDAATMKTLDEALQNWDSGDSEVRKCFEESQKKWAGIIQPLVEAISESERLANDDLAVRINMRL